MIWRSGSRQWRRKRSASIRAPATAETLDATYKENVKDYALRVPYVSLAGLTSIIDFRAEVSAEVKKLALEKMFDNSLLQEIEKEQSLAK